MRVYSGRKFAVEVEEVILPNGKSVKVESVRHPGSVVVIPLLGDEVILIRQYRPVIGQWILELPAGTLNPGEDVKSAAIRELSEETGYEAEEIREILTFYPSPGISDELMHVFLATRLRAGKARPEEYELITLYPVKLRQALDMVMKGQILDAKTVASLLYLSLLKE
jgi:ADP-ribose pyrophosphatase